MDGNGKKEILKSLSEKVGMLTKQLKDYDDLKKKVKELEEKINVFENGKNSDEEIISNLQKCKTCEKSFNSKKNLKKHVKEVHPQEVKCTKCEKTFARICDFEEHIEADHKAQHKYDCRKCDKTFILSWRLRKHEEVHTSNTTRFCHYYNNGKNCPFEKLGCMFPHKQSESCRFDEECSKPLCPYKHSKKNLYENNDEQTSNKSDTDDDSVSCTYCHENFEDIDDLIAHYGVTEHNLDEDQHSTPRW